MIIYGIKNCDTMKKALRWLESHGLEHAFHDYKKKGISETKLKAWVKVTGWEALLNRRGTSWRKLKTPAIEKDLDPALAIKLMLENTSLIKRPVLETSNDLLVGFSEQEYANKLA